LGRLIDFGDTKPHTKNGRTVWISHRIWLCPNGINFEVSGTDPGNRLSQKYCRAPILDNQGKIHLVFDLDSIAGIWLFTNGVLMGITSM